MLKTEKGDATRSTCGDEMLLFMFRQLREAVKFLGIKERQHEAPGKTIGLQGEGPCLEGSWIAILKTSSLSYFAQPVIENSYADCLYRSQWKLYAA
jgi:hypothetical protein